MSNVKEYKQARIYGAYKVSFTVPAREFGCLRDFAIDRLIDLQDVKSVLDYKDDSELCGMPAQIERVDVMETVEEMPNCEREAYQLRINVPAGKAPFLKQYAEDGEVSAEELMGIIDDIADAAIDERAEVERVKLNQDWASLEG